MIKTTSSFLMCFRNSKGLASYTIKIPSYINFYFSDLKLLLTESKTNTGSYPWQISLTFFSSFFLPANPLSYISKPQLIFPPIQEKRFYVIFMTTQGNLSSFFLTTSLHSSPNLYLLLNIV